MKSAWVSLGLVWFGVWLCGCGPEASGDLMIQNRSSGDIVIKFPHDGPFSEVVPAHSEATVMRNIQISGRQLYADVFDAKTHRLFLRGPAPGPEERTFAEKGHILIVYDPKTEVKGVPARPAQ